jgi:hypothetical protein
MTGRIFSPSVRRPMEVVGADGQTHYFFCRDLEAYKEAMSAGLYPISRTHWGDPPAQL